MTAWTTLSWMFQACTTPRPGGVLSMFDKDGDENQGTSVDRAARRQFGCLNSCSADKLEAGLGSIYTNQLIVC